MPTLSAMLVLPFRLILMVPVPVMPETLTLTELPVLAETLDMVPEAVPVPIRVKSSVEMLMTGLLKVAVNATLASPGAGEPLTAMLLTVGIRVSTVALAVLAVVVMLPALSAALMLALRLFPATPAGSGWVAVQIPAALVVGTATGPLKADRLMVTALMVSVLLSPAAVLFHWAVTVSPALKAPPTPDAPDRAMLPGVTTGAMVSTVALFVPAVVAGPLLLLAVTDTLRFVASMAPADSKWVAVQMPAELRAATEAPPPNWDKSKLTPVIGVAL